MVAMGIVGMGMAVMVVVAVLSSCCRSFRFLACTRAFLFA